MSIYRHHNPQLMLSSSEINSCSVYTAEGASVLLLDGFWWRGLR